MKQFAYIILILLSVALTGCQTPKMESQVDTKETTIANVIQIVSLAAHHGTRNVLFDNPDHFPKFKKVAEELEFLIESEQFEIDELRRVLKKLPVKELKGEKGMIILKSALVIFDNYYRDWVDLKKVDYIKPVMHALHIGIRRGMEDSRLPDLNLGPPKPPGME